MIQKLVKSDAGVTVIGGGEVKPDDLLTALGFAPTLVAADGGADRALALGKVPGWVIGDLDSISDAARDIIPVDRIVHVAEQDSTDFTKCLNRIDAPFVLAVGFAGLRLDHTLAALTSIVSSETPLPIMLTSEDVVFQAPPYLSLPVMPGTRVSLYPMGQATGVSTGLEWPIDGIEFAPELRGGTSNRATGSVDLKIKGTMLILLPRDTLPIVLAALALT